MLASEITRITAHCNVNHSHSQLTRCRYYNSAEVFVFRFI